MAFRGNQLTSVTIPDSITYINAYTFIDNPGLEELNGKVEGIVSKNNSNITLGSNP